MENELRDAVITCEVCQETALVSKAKKEGPVQNRNTEYFYDIFIRIRHTPICCEKSVVTIWSFN